MILLDTNVVSELMRPTINPTVAAFVDRHRLGEFFLPSLVVAEIRYGLQRLPAGQRRRSLEGAFDDLLETGFHSRILPFDAACAVGYATVRGNRERSGRSVQMPDALIGGMALVQGATLATRNVADFDGCGLAVVNPWEPAS